MFEVGTLVQYGCTGVCKIEEIREQEFPATGEKRLYYMLAPLYERTKISVPVDSDKIFLREIITKEEAEHLISIMPTLHPEICHSRVTRELTERYETILKSHDCEQIAELALSIYHKKLEAAEHNRKFGSIDEKFLRQAENLLFGELAAALEIPRESVLDYIDEKLQAAEE